MKKPALEMGQGALSLLYPFPFKPLPLALGTGPQPLNEADKTWNRYTYPTRGVFVQAGPALEYGYMDDTKRRI